ncbi:signal peptidase II [Candidatus Pelagibacter sp.]|nr:signal peptidase II [Candidatus Pelagibacter sp.]
MLKKQFILNSLIIFLIFFLDRLSKFYILNIAENEGTVNITINSFLNVILVWNAGIGFGLLQFDQTFVYNLITILIFLINLLIIYLLFNAEKLHKIFFAMILGGSLGNLYDRVYYSAVPDFIDLNYNGYHWFVFNVADIFITIGIFALIFSEIFKKKNEA